MKTLNQYVNEESDSLIILTNSNCVFNNFITLFLSRGIDPVLIFGSMIGFITSEMQNREAFLSNYIDFHFKQVWGMSLFDYYMFHITQYDVDSVENFQQFLTKRITNFHKNAVLGMVLNVKYIFYRNDIDINFWEEEGIEHFFLVSDFDFEKDECIVIDTYDTKKYVNGFICEKIAISHLLSQMQKDRNFCWVTDNEGIISYIKEFIRKEQFIIKNIETMVFQARHRINLSASKYISPIRWLLDQIEQEENVNIWSKWLHPKINIFLTISLHRYFVCDFIKIYASKYSNKNVDSMIQLLVELEEKLEQSKYLAYKLSVTKRNGNLQRIQRDIYKNLLEVDEMEINLACMILDTFNRAEMYLDKKDQRSMV